MFNPEKYFEIVTWNPENKYKFLYAEINGKSYKCNPSQKIGDVIAKDGKVNIKLYESKSNLNNAYTEWVNANEMLKKNSDIDLTTLFDNEDVIDGLPIIISRIKENNTYSKAFKFPPILSPSFFGIDIEIGINEISKPIKIEFYSKNSMTCSISFNIVNTPGSISNMGADLIE